MRGGFGGLPGGNMSGTIKPAQKLQADMQKTQEELENQKLIQIKTHGSSNYISYFTPFDKSTKAYENFENIAYKYQQAV